VIGGVIVGVLAEGAFLAAADETGNCKTKAMAHALVTTANSALIEAGIRSLRGDDSSSDPSADLRFHAINVFVNGALADEGVHGYAKEALIEAVKEKFSDDPLAVAYAINFVDHYSSCEEE